MGTLRVQVFYFVMWCATRRSIISSIICYFIEDIVSKIKETNVGCYVSSVCATIVLYADDILLLAPTVTGLQHLLTVCERELVELDMHVNVNKSMCIRFGQRSNVQCADLSSKHGGSLKWVNSCRYLGVHFVSGRTLKCSLTVLSLNFVERSMPSTVK